MYSKQVFKPFILYKYYCYPKLFKRNTHNKRKMVSITLSVPEDLKHDMEGFPDINWSAVAREAIKRRIGKII